MGNYWEIENTKENREKFREIYYKHLKLNGAQFKNDFGAINTCEEIWCDGYVKNGVMDKDFYSRAFCEEVVEAFKLAPLEP